ncbi:hypothetical protein [Streptomyces sp. NPDC001435]|uniref:hypothetical protein n=1 Tax=unclassified Streptomyces TaxID=2593676 RepID=UPI00368B00F1
MAGNNRPASGAARLHLADKVPLLRPEEQVFEAMLDGWRNQQLARNLALSTINGRERKVRAFVTHADAFPWSWSSTLADEWFGDLRAVRGCVRSTLRGYQEAVRLFCDYATDPGYDWAAECDRRFGTHPIQCATSGTPPCTCRSARPSPRNGPSPGTSCRRSSTTPTTR